MYAAAIDPYCITGSSVLKNVPGLRSQASHPLDLDQLDPAAFLPAMIASFHGGEQPLTAQIAGLAGGNRS